MDFQTASNTQLEAEAKKLRRHFKFTEEDLRMNERGELSEKQKQRMEKYDLGGRKLGIFFGSVLILSGLLLGGFDYSMYASFNTPSFNPSGGGLATAIPAACMGLFALLLAGAGAFLVGSQFIKHKAFQVLNIRGPARLESGTARSGGRVYYDLYINDQQFDGDGTMPKVIQEGAVYVVYYLNTTEEILSVARAG
jgi:hypothetical protein